LTAPRAHLRNNHPKILAARLGCAIAASQLSTIDLGVAIVVTHKFAAQPLRKLDHSTARSRGPPLVPGFLAASMLCNVGFAECATGIGN